MTFLTIAMDVTKTVTEAGKNSRVKVGSVDIYVPSIAELAKDAVQATDAKGIAMVDDDGLPVYTDNNLNWVQSAIYAQVKAQARNKLKPSTADLKDGAKIATDWAELTAENTGGGAEHLAAIREVKALFARWVATLGKSAPAQEQITGLFNSPDKLSVSNETVRGKMLGYLGDFVETLEDVQTAKFVKYLEKLENSATAEVTEAEDF